MKRLGRVAMTVALAATGAGAAQAQTGIRVKTAVLYETYSVDSLFVFADVSELTVPVVITVPYRQLGSLTISGGYARVRLKSAVDPALLGNQSIGGLLDTHLRLAVNAIPGKLVLIANGVVPSNLRTLSENQLFALGPVASDIVGFSAGALGSGGSVGGGFAGALPLGGWALGIGATYNKSLAYVPVLGRSDELLPGGELRARIGIEGALARRTYLRVAGIYALRQKDQINGVTQNGLGNRIIGYLALNQGFGGNTLTLYGFDVFRGSPQLEATAVGAAYLPRGNLIAMGFRFGMPLGRKLTLTPRGEYRISAAAADTADAALRRAGNTMRLGADFSVRAGRTTTFTLVGSGLFGSAVQAGTDIGLRGARFGLNVEFRP